jgi:D-beta-D-heptose 7-phosphate kinase/D-beta-D-heptose 1-phosphate adenosyltransferase
MKILVIGDIILDINYFVETTRRAAEADIPIYKIHKITHLLGGAGNVALNMRNIGCNVKVISTIGNDLQSKIIHELFENNNINYKLFTLNNKPTTQKYRYFNNNKLINRVDMEDDTPLDIVTENMAIEYINNIQYEGIDGIILSDYNKGFLTPYLCQKVIQNSNKHNIPTFVDPKTEDFYKYKDCFLFKPNLKEAQLMSKEVHIKDMFHRLHSFIQCDYILLTASENGMYLFEDKNNRIIHIPQKSIHAIDVTGAGDTVICSICFMYLTNKNILNSAYFSSYIASLSIRYIGNYVMTNKDIELFDILQNKIIYDYEIDKLMLLCKYYNKITFSNGCFDILHAAHLHLFKYLRTVDGDCVIIGLNSDNSIKRLKGEDRPINNIIQRTEALKALDMIDFIIIFDENTPRTIIQYIMPHTIVKGGDYKKEDVVGYDIVKQVEIFNYIDGYSTTSIIKKSRSLINL